MRDIEEKIRLLQSDELTQSRIYQLQYQQALRKQVAAILDKLQDDEYATIQQYLHDSYQDGYIGSMYSIHGQGVPLILPLDQDAAVKAIVTDSKISEGLYNHLGVNVKQLKQAISSEITRGIASNMPFADIARNISNRSKAPLARAKTIVRTEGHRIRCQAAYNAAVNAKKNGADIVLQWDATTDKRTRSSHARLDGQIVEVGERFSNGLLYPGDSVGKVEDVVNCRCVALTRARWALDEDELQTMKERAEFFGIDKKDDFKAFEEKYLKAAEKQQKTAETLDKSGKSGIIKEEQTASAGVLDSFSRKTHIADYSDDIKKVNPNYTTGLYKWTHNCQRCVPTYEMRRRGYAVTAKPLPQSDVNKDLLAMQPWLAWNAPEIKGYKSRADIEKAMSAMKDGTRVQIKIVWRNGTGHTFVAEQHGDKTVFIDPQTGNMDCSDYFDNMKNSWDNLYWVISGKSPSDWILECCE